MPFRKRRPDGGHHRYWYIKPRITPFGRLGPWSTGTESKDVASQMEAMLRRLALTGQGRFIRMLLEGNFTVRDLWYHYAENTLSDLEAQQTDPLLQGRLKEFRDYVKDERALSGLSALERLLKDEKVAQVRRSWLEDPKNVRALLAKREAEGARRNSVRRSMYRVIRQFLAHELDDDRADVIMKKTKFTSEKDTRNVVVSPEQIHHVLSLCDGDFRDLIICAIVGSIDRSPLLRLRPKHFADGADPILRVPDSKNEFRFRTLRCPPAMAAALRRASAGKRPEDPMFTLTAEQVRYRWTRVRRAAGVPDLRFKDLRHVFPLFFEGSIKELGQWMGHADPNTTTRYIGLESSQDRQKVEAAERAMGLSGPVLKVEEA